MAEWITLEDAERRGVDLSWVSDAIGPRRPGTLYLGGYCRDVNTVLAVRVKVEGPRAVHFHITERDTTFPRPRRHCTSWLYDNNVILHGPTDTRMKGRN
jgi:hypothetical protein